MAKHKKTFKYTIELTEPIYPRHLADYMTMQPMFARQLVSVQDMQRADHWYADNNRAQSDTYLVARDEDEQEERGLDETGTHPPDCRCSWCEPSESEA